MHKALFKTCQNYYTQHVTDVGCNETIYHLKIPVLVWHSSYMKVTMHWYANEEGTDPADSCYMHAWVMHKCHNGKRLPYKDMIINYSSCLIPHRSWIDSLAILALIQISCLASTLSLAWLQGSFCFKHWKVLQENSNLKGKTVIKCPDI